MRLGRRILWRLTADAGRQIIDLLRDHITAFALIEHNLGTLKRICIFLA